MRFGEYLTLGQGPNFCPIDFSLKNQDFDKKNALK